MPNLDNLKLTPFSLGTWHTFEDCSHLSAAMERLTAAFELGVRSFDTADVYGNGEAEKLLGKGLKLLPQDEIFVSTKCGLPVEGLKTNRGLSAAHIKGSIERSLKNLGLEKIDVLYCHRPDPDTPVKETIETMQQLIAQGKILNWGISKFSPELTSQVISTCNALSAPLPLLNQHGYNLLFKEIESEILPLCRNNNIGLVAYSPLAQGTLSGKYNSTIPPNSRASNQTAKKMMWNLDQDSLEKAQELETLSKEMGCSLSQLSLSWCLHQKGVASVLFGASKISQIEENVKAQEIHLSQDILEKIDTIVEAQR